MAAGPDTYAGMAAAYALGALDEAERREFELHLESCPECVAAVEDYRQTAGVLPYELAILQPPAGAREALIGAARARVKPAAPARRAWFRLPAWQHLGWVTAVVVIAGLVAWNLSLRSSDEPNAGLLAAYERVINLDGTGAAGASARLYIAPGETAAQLEVRGLEPLPPDRIYQLWFASPGRPITTGGPFRVNDNGDALAAMVIPVSLSEVTAIAVTQEAAPGKLQDPTGMHLLDGKP